MKLRTIRAKLQRALKRPSNIEKAILRHEDVNAEFLNIGVTAEQIVDKINAFDWLDLSEAKTEDEMAIIFMRLFESFNIECPKAYRLIVLKAFTHKCLKAIEYLKEAITSVDHAYNVEGGSKGFTNKVVDKLYYITYWANKKNIPVNYNEKDQEKRALFNLDTIILSILADKLQVFNDYERNKPKKQ